MLDQARDLKIKLVKNQLSLGTWVTLSDPAIAEILSLAGVFEWIVVDLEHTALSISQACNIIRTIDLSKLSPLVRLTCNDANLIKRVMDAGAHGIIVPCVVCANDAKKAVDATRYPTIGNRGVGLARAQGYGTNFKNYLEWQKNGPIVIVQIEHKDALANLEKILEIDGVDGFIIGPYDLSASMGIAGEFKHPEFVEAVNFILSTGRRLGSTAGIHIVEPNPAQLSEAIREGYSFIAYSVDIRMIALSVETVSASISDIN
jgi:2-keto-3-deoxy-L-rhamnonate aldolase RhmA